ncbi:MAG: hypothetical protein HY054_04160 [Proteobacteria bacterium]|nr:hypothetical protein [Pseudomonadota bacterium]
MSPRDMMRFTISGRGKPQEMPILPFLSGHFRVPLEDVDSVFGFVEESTLYGGRIFQAPELSENDVEALYGAGIGVRLPLSNHFVTRDEYEAATPFLGKYHREKNAVIITNDDLARWVREDFPLYRIEASVIKNLRSYNRITAALDLYDTVVLPMELNQDENFLRSAPSKERITLFANAGCALTCPSKICYVSISKINKTGEGYFNCSQNLKPRALDGMVDFDLDTLQDLGFSRFKLLRARPGGLTGH